MIERNKEEVEIEIRNFLNEESKKVFDYLVKDPEIEAFQERADRVSSVRLLHNDHGPLHMRMASLNAVKICKILQNNGVKLSLEEEQDGDFNDSLNVVLIASFLHDIGMSATRESHEITGMILANSIIEKLLIKFYPYDIKKNVILRSIIMECILGHMTTKKISSKEAGIVLVADGCDMQMGRARLPTHNNIGKHGDIHMYSSRAVDNLNISEGSDRPISIEITLNESVGFFQVEEVLLPKILSSTIKQYIELIAGIKGGEKKRYL